MIASTHTHSSPSSNAIEGEPAVVAYRKVIVGGMAESIVKAHELLKPQPEARILDLTVTCMFVALAGTLGAVMLALYSVFPVG